MPVSVLANPLSNAATLTADIKAALPAITVMAINGALNFVAAILILVAGWWLSRAAYRGIRRGLGRSAYVDATLKPLIANAARYAILVITLVAVLGQFGVQTTSLIAVVGAAGLAIGLALQGTLSNVASGVMLLLLRPFRVHEYIVAAGTSGTVEEIGLFRTALLTDDGIYVSIPNSTLFSGTVSNNTRTPNRRINLTFDVDYRNDMERVLQITRDTLAADARILPTPAPYAQVTSLSGAAVNIQALAWTVNADFFAVQRDFLKNIRTAFNDAGIAPALPVLASDLHGNPVRPAPNPTR